MPELKVSYRTVRYQGDRETPDLEEMLRFVLQTRPFSVNYSDRAFRISDTGARGAINRFDADPPGVLIELHQFDSRRQLPFVRHQDVPAAQAQVRHRDVPDNEDHLGASAFFLVFGNHMAVIEGLGFRTAQIQMYINSILQAAGQLGPDEIWTLAPKVELADGLPALSRGITRLEVKPIARLMGDGPSQMAARRRPRQTTAGRDHKVAQGGKISSLIELLGASEADLDGMLSNLSTDLGIEAKVVLTVRRDAKFTTAQLDADDISQAIASLEEENTVTVVSPDGKQQGRLVTLSRMCTIGVDGGLLQWEDVVRELAAALQTWINSVTVAEH